MVTMAYAISVPDKNLCRWKGSRRNMEFVCYQWSRTHWATIRLVSHTFAWQRILCSSRNTKIAAKPYECFDSTIFTWSTRICWIFTAAFVVDHKTGRSEYRTRITGSNICRTRIPVTYIWKIFVKTTQNLYTEYNIVHCRFRRLRCHIEPERCHNCQWWIHVCHNQVWLCQQVHIDAICFQPTLKLTIVIVIGYLNCTATKIASACIQSVGIRRRIAAARIEIVDQCIRFAISTCIKVNSSYLLQK